MIHFFLIILVMASLLQGGLWLLARSRRNMGWVDFGWSTGLAVAAVILFSIRPAHPRTLGVSILLFAWALRLSTHVLKDRLLGNTPEDSRYQALRAHWGDAADAKFFWFFQAQALLVAVFALPAAVVTLRQTSFPDRWDLLGFSVAAGAVLLEALADRQLAAFRRDPDTKGKVCTRGLWRYSRHPNYFFEWLHWFGYVFLATGGPLSWMTLLGPVLIYIFLRYVTGIPHAERQSLRSRGDAYKEYQRTTPVFFPWMPRKP